ncbi:MAG: DUF1549 domain-containing protein, partial [Bryobacteraceae bacterium]|nr:DUF1549 domain-containing protein [Bryobacteraceae bacterium]
MAADSRSIEFNRDVRPIFSDKCFTCHGPDASAKKIPFRLDRESAAKADLGGHKAIVDGDSAASTVVARITETSAARKMPPAYSGLSLTTTEIETIRTWIDQGAKWQKHWSFIPPARVALPEVKHKSWPRNQIDYFVLDQIERNGLKPSPEASRERLIRRVSLDLTGLPPTLAETDNFLSDKSLDAWEKVVDRLLASPRYGERMASRWLDAARYADTNGYQFDGERIMWRWRDWVIDSFNRNQRFDEFTVEQIAGDLIPNATTQQRVATGFNRNHRANTEDGIVAEEYAVEYVVDRVETTSTVFLGLTLGCARCHNHKYDPLSQKEFYQMFAYFNNVPELGRAIKYGNSPPFIPAPTLGQQSELERLMAKLRAEQSALSARAQEIRDGQIKWELSAAKSPAQWWKPESGLEKAFSFDEDGGPEAKEGNLETVEGKIGQASLFDGKAYIEAGDAGGFDIDERFSVSAWFYSAGTPDGSLLSRMIDGPKGKGYGLHLDKGRIHFNLTSIYESDSIRVESTEVVKPQQWHHIAVTYDGSIAASGIHIWIDGKPTKLIVLADNLYRPFNNAGKRFREPFRIGTGWGKERRFQGKLDDIRLYSRVLSDIEIAAVALGESVHQIASKAEANRSTAENNVLRWSYLEHGADTTVRELWSRVNQLEREREKLEKTFPTVMVMAENPTPRKTNLLLRGAYDKPGPEVERGVPQVLHSLATRATNQGANDRLALANWLTDPLNPLTARVTVNRFWQLLFGTGLVKTTEDFGVQGDWPSNPDLLDWLATEFVRNGYDVKATMRLMVTSAAYRQASETSPELLQKDPENRLIARGPRHRLPPEMVRDQALAAAGLLVEKIGGPSVKPYQPAGLWKEQSMQDMDYIQGRGPDLYRRSLYTFWKRTIPPPMMMNFDAS